ncbi:C3a anaphylatoxin chemotactic receptor-like isoform X2 [Corythoichthys intestinalis]|uniref:C3a anaphylatoxin chemotactic receptor-like isoform X2 n=1 Tax=Corythoichthys intestinalis TaxID=161448 RepID=UPI0025A67F43|nr:C3a anaphylatoxin chemotactic receptor-like isoform X2 [Corythoichthys intestinalis]
MKGARPVRMGQSLCEVWSGTEIATVLNVWLVNLAVADLILCFSRILSLVKDLFLNEWLFGLFICRFNGFFKYTNMFCSVFMLAIISGDRAVCVWFPVFTRNHRTVCLARVVAACTWLMAAALSLPFYFCRILYKDNNLIQCRQKNKKALYLIRFLCGFLLPFLVILGCYILAAVGIRRIHLAGKLRALCLMVLLVLVFFVCWAPYHGLLLLEMVDSSNSVHHTWLPATITMSHIKSCINPLLYFLVGFKNQGRSKKSVTGLCKSALIDGVERQTPQSIDSGENVSHL